MIGLGTTRQGWRDRLLAELKGDKRKSALLGGLLLVGAIVGVRMLFSGPGSGPAVAEARPAGSAPDAAVSLSSPMPGPIPAGTSAASSAHADIGAKPGPGAGDLRTLDGRHKITQDIFAPRLAFFPVEEEPKPAPATAPATQPANPEKTHEAELRDAAKSLSLQSTIVSSDPKAVINGQLVGVGDLISGFKVVTVTAHTCVLAQDGVQVQLEMMDR